MPLPFLSSRVPGRRAAAVAALLGFTAAAAPRAARAAATPDSTLDVSRLVTVVPGEHYRAGALHRFLLGDDYRRLWSTAIDVPVLDLRSFAGGLKAVRRVGGQQTPGLALKGADGRDYTFRGLDKDPSDILKGMT